jgi:hypothetical protein
VGPGKVDVAGAEVVIAEIKTSVANSKVVATAKVVAAILKTSRCNARHDHSAMSYDHCVM